MFLPGISVICSVLYLVQADPMEDTGEIKSCDMNFKFARDAGADTTLNITEACITPCIVKCCPENQILIQRNGSLSCNTIRIPYNYSYVEIWEKDIKHKIKKSNKTFEQFTRIYSERYTDGNCLVMNIEKIFPSPNNKAYILEDGSLSIRKFNYYNQWPNGELPMEEFCVEIQATINQDGSITKQLAIMMTLEGDDAVDGEDESTDYRNTITASGMVVSIVFLALVLAVYALLPQLRNLAGLMLMAYVATLATAFLARAVQVIGTNYVLLNDTACQFVGSILYYAMIASFTWMNVMSFDIWWSMRGFRKLRQIHRRGILVKFGWYSVYGWGAPLLPFLLIVVVDNMDLTHMPDFIKPHLLDGTECFMKEEERQFYMNGPILITTCINIALFLLTAYNIWRIRQGVSQHSAGESRRNRKDETRFNIYLKLSLVMGINWILEVASSIYNPDSTWWYISDIFNCLIGVFIFWIFVCKRSVVGLLCKRFSIENDFIRRWQPVESSRNENSRLNSISKRKMQDSFATDSSDIEDSDKKYCTQTTVPKKY